MLRDLVLRSHPAAVSMLYALTFTVLGLSFGHGLRQAAFPPLWVGAAFLLVLTVMVATGGPALTGLPVLDALIKGANLYLVLLITLQGLPHFIFSFPSILPNFLLTWLTIAFIIRVPLRRQGLRTY